MKSLLKILTALVFIALSASPVIPVILEEVKNSDKDKVKAFTRVVKSRYLYNKLTFAGFLQANKAPLPISPQNISGFHDYKDVPVKEYKVSFSIHNTELELLKQNMTPYLELPDANELDYNFIEGKFVSKKVDMNFPEEQSIITTVFKANNLTKNLKIGKYINVYFRFNEVRDIYVPMEYIRYENKLPFVFVFNKYAKTAEKRYLSLGGKYNNLIVIKKGLKNNDHIIIGEETKIEDKSLINVVGVDSVE
ncbi:MAG: hypothetical protein ABIA04_05105 [Pseudomonadota bacterium]